jgi:ubiquinone/menaquinone biosynthesis C-methylase UbiE
MNISGFWQDLWNEKAGMPTDFQATGRGGMDAVGFLHTVAETVRLLGLDRRHELLDIGCGTGVFALALSPWLKRIHGIDIAENAVERAQRNLADFPNASFAQGTITAIPEADRSYDRALAYSVLQYLSNEDEMLLAFQEVHRVLRSGGKALLAANPDPARRARLVDAIMQKPDAGMRQMELDLLDRTLWVTPTRMVELARQAGLDAVAEPISSRIWQSFYMFDLMVTRHG